MSDPPSFPPDWLAIPVRFVGGPLDGRQIEINLPPGWDPMDTPSASWELPGKYAPETPGRFTIPADAERYLLFRHPDGSYTYQYQPEGRLT